MKYIIILLFTAIELNCSIVVNEFMSAPINNEPEWIELYNCGSETAVFDTLYIVEGSGSKQFISISLQSESYALITKDTSELKLHRNIPANCKLIYCKLPALNNTLDFVVLKDNFLNIIDSVYYDMDWGVKGKSFERINCNYSGNYPDNIAVTKSSDSATCGYLNSNSKTANDLAIENIIIENTGFHFDIVNRGLNDFADIQLELGIIINSENKILKTENIQVIQASDYNTIYLSYEDIRNSFNIKGEFIAYIKLINSDDRPENNNKEIKIFLSYNFSDILFNEILFDNDENMSEFIEIYNNTDNAVNMKNWGLIDYSSANPDTLMISETDFNFVADSYMLLISDTSIFKSFPNLSKDKIIILSNKIQLNNTSDKLKIVDANNHTIDSLLYSSKWVNSELFPLKNRSLEKKRNNIESNIQDNWASSLSDMLSTPTEINSTYKDNSNKINIFIKNNPISKSKISDNEIIVNSIFKSSYLTAKLLDLDGRTITEIANLKTVGAEFSLDLSSGISGLEIGPYILLVELTDVQNRDYEANKALIVIGK